MSAQSHDNTGGDTASRLRTLVLGAIGVVYGDIGTSPLYTIRQTFGEHGVAATPGNVLGVLSLVFWSLILVVSVKYAGFIMRADNKGEGGIMALTALAQRSVRSSRRGRWWIVMLGLFGASLFFGDGVITPAISVLGAVEGLEVLAPRLEHWVVPISAIIIVALFAVQNRGTGRVGLVFAPVMILWFAALAALGIWHVAQNPGVLRALSPHYAIEFFLHAKWSAFFALGSVILAITGAEALYADMGHFGKKPIRWSWFGFVLPALVLNYFGQGALLIADPKTAENPLYLMVPQSMLVPMLLLATAAAVIASQAVISGAFSVTREAIQLGFLPRMQVRHTSDEQIGQVYLPWINRMLMIMTLAVVLGFRSSDNLGAAYGIAVVGTMTIDSVLVMIVFRRLWNWSRARARGRPAVPVRRPRLPHRERGQGRAWRLVPARARQHHLHRHVDVAPRQGTRHARDQAGRPRARAVHRLDRRASAAARAGHGDLPHREPGRRAARAAAQPQAQQGAARAQHHAHRGNRRHANGRAGRMRVRAAARRRFLRGDAALRLRRGHGRAAGARCDQELRPGARHDGHDVLPQPRKHRRHRPSRHGAVARPPVRVPATQCLAGDRVLPHSRQPAHRAGTQVEI
jgi:hypothetical protein